MIDPPSLTLRQRPQDMVEVYAGQGDDTFSKSDSEDRKCLTG
jgi:hypothetical protein